MASVISTLAHEAGHARQIVLNPSQLTNDNGALKEAEAFAFEAALIRKLGLYTRLNTSNFPDILRSFVDDSVTSFQSSIDDLEAKHARGRLLVWLAVLGNPEFTALKNELLDDNVLSPESLLILHDHFVNLRPAEIDEYVESLLSMFPENRNRITAAIDKRVGFGVKWEGFIKHAYQNAIVP